MIDSPWDIALTVLFTATGLFCLWHLSSCLATPRGREPGEDGRTVDLLHLIMSVAMIVMIWAPFGTVGTWVQVVVFAILGLVLLVIAVGRGTTARMRVDLGAHVMLSAAMAWMLGAMPLMMAGMSMSSGGSSGHEGHEGHDMAMDMGSETASLSSTPGWVTAITWILVALCVVSAIWWLYRMVSSARHRGHALCHLGMSAGMGLMLALMIG